MDWAWTQPCTLIGVAENNSTTWNVASPHSLGDGMWAGTAVVALDTMLWANP